MSDTELLMGEDSKLEVQTEIEEKVLTITANATPEGVGTDKVKREGTKFFAPGGKLGAFFGAVKPDDIKISKKTAVRRPYWRISGGFACRYLRRHSHKLSLDDSPEIFSLPLETTLTRAAPDNLSPKFPHE